MEKVTAQDTEHEERPEGVIGQWYTLTSDFDGNDQTDDRKAGYTWLCEKLDIHGEPTIDGVGIVWSETYRKATPEEINAAMAKRDLDPQQGTKQGLTSDYDKYDFINPDHYKQGSKEVIEMMEDIWGAEAVATYCEINAFKYRMRLGNKPDQPIERDLEKAKWYENKAKELKR